MRVSCFKYKCAECVGLMVWSANLRSLENRKKKVEKNRCRFHIEEKIRKNSFFCVWGRGWGGIMAEAFEVHSTQKTQKWGRMDFLPVARCI